MHRLKLELYNLSPSLVTGAGILLVTISNTRFSDFASLCEQQWRIVQALKVSGVCDSEQVMPITFCHHFKRLSRATSTALNDVEYQ